MLCQLCVKYAIFPSEFWVFISANKLVYFHQLFISHSHCACVQYPPALGFFLNCICQQPAFDIFGMFGFKLTGLKLLWRLLLVKFQFSETDFDTITALDPLGFKRIFHTLILCLYSSNVEWKMTKKGRMLVCFSPRSIKAYLVKRHVTQLAHFT